MHHIFHKIFAAQLFSILIIRNVSWAANKHITKISEGSCDTEDWSNAAENSAFPYDQINAALVNIRDVFQKNYTVYTSF